MPLGLYLHPAAMTRREEVKEKRAAQKPELKRVMFRMRIQSKWHVLSRKLVKIDMNIVIEAKKDKKVARNNEKKWRLAVASAKEMPSKKARKSKMESGYAVIYRINTVYYYQLQYK